MKISLDWIKLPSDRSIRYLSIILFAALLVMATVDGAEFFSLDSLQSMTSQMPILGFLSLGMAVCMLTGGINLSIIATANACALVMGSILTLLPDSGTILVLAVLSGFLTASLIGLLNGALIAYVGVSPILATLGTMKLLDGLNVLISGGRVLSGFPTAFLQLGDGLVCGIPTPLILFIVFSIFLWAVLERSTLGKAVYLLGSNEKATRFSGINTAKVKLVVYIISAISCWIAAIVMMGKFNSARAGYGESYLLTAILASVLGGIDPDGGFGRVIALVLALAVLQTLESGLNLLGVSSYLTMALWGGILIVFLFLQRMKVDGE